MHGLLRDFSNFFQQDVPDATTLLYFRHLLEEKGISKLFFDAINRCLEQAGWMIQGDSTVDAALISAPSSTKNVDKKRDPEMHSVKKGNQWHFGMKCHTGVDAGSGFVHTVEATAANVHDITAAERLLRENNKVVYGDSTYLGIEKPKKAKDSPQLSDITYRMNRRPGRLPKISDNAVEHPYRIVKTSLVSKRPFTGGLEKIRTDYMCFSPVQICICLQGRVAHSEPHRTFAPFEQFGGRNMWVFPLMRCWRSRSPHWWTMASRSFCPEWQRQPIHGPPSPSSVCEKRIPRSSSTVSSPARSRRTSGRLHRGTSIILFWTGRMSPMIILCRN